jgi:hypothetical protein
MTRELIAFLAGFGIEQPAPRRWWLLRRIASSRVYYELSLAYVAEDGLAASALRPLLKSVFCYPPFALRRPLLTAHIAKEILAGRLRAIARTAEPANRTG